MIVSGLGSIHRAHEHLLARTEEAVRRSEERAGWHALEQIQTNAPFKRRTGNLQDSAGFKLIKVGGRILRVFDKAKYANAIEYGSRPHIIRAKNKQFLRFKGSGGQWVFRRLVHHPGNKPYKFLWKATWSAHRVLGEVLEHEMESIAKQF